MIMLPGDRGLAAGAAGAEAVSTVCGRSATRSSTGCKLSGQTSHFLPVSRLAHVRLNVRTCKWLRTRQAAEGMKS